MFEEVSVCVCVCVQARMETVLQISGKRRAYTVRTTHEKNMELRFLFHNMHNFKVD